MSDLGTKGWEIIKEQEGTIFQLKVKIDELERKLNEQQQFEALAKLRLEAWTEESKKLTLATERDYKQTQLSEQAKKILLDPFLTDNEALTDEINEWLESVYTSGVFRQDHCPHCTTTALNGAPWTCPHGVDFNGGSPRQVTYGSPAETGNVQNSVDANQVTFWSCLCGCLTNYDETCRRCGFEKPVATAKEAVKEPL